MCGGCTPADRLQWSVSEGEVVAVTVECVAGSGSAHLGGVGLVPQVEDDGPVPPAIPDRQGSELGLEGDGATGPRAMVGAGGHTVHHAGEVYVAAVDSGQ